MSDERRFEVGLSFPGEVRDFVGAVAGRLSETYTQERVLYDKYHEAELARPDLDVYLPLLYKQDSELIVIFLCQDYQQKRWCKLEWRYIKELIATADAARIMFLSFGPLGDLSSIGILSGDGYADIGSRTADQIADLILQRSRQMMSGRSVKVTPDSSNHLPGIPSSTASRQTPAVGEGQSSHAEGRSFSPIQRIAVSILVICLIFSFSPLFSGLVSYVHGSKTAEKIDASTPVPSEFLPAPTVEPNFPTPLEITNSQSTPLENVVFVYRNETKRNLRLLLFDCAKSYRSSEKHDDRIARSCFRDWPFTNSSQNGGNERFSKFPRDSNWFAFYVFDPKDSKAHIIGFYDLTKSSEWRLIVRDVAGAVRGEMSHE